MASLERKLRKTEATNKMFISYRISVENLVRSTYQSKNAVQNGTELEINGTKKRLNLRSGKLGLEEKNLRIEDSLRLGLKSEQDLSY